MHFHCSKNAERQKFCLTYGPFKSPSVALVVLASQRGLEVFL